MSAPFSGMVRFVALASVLLGLSLNHTAAQPKALADTSRLEVQIQNRSVIGERTLRLTQDQVVEIVWATDEPAELHIHGYDIRFEITPDAPVAVGFTAHATGRFAVTSHGFGGEHGHQVLLYIEVYPK